MWWVGIFGVVAFTLKWLERSSIATAAWHLANTARCGIFVMIAALIPVAVTEMLQQTWLAATDRLAGVCRLAGLTFLQRSRT